MSSRYRFRLVWANRPRMPSRIRETKQATRRPVPTRLLPSLSAPTTSSVETRSAAVAPGRRYLALCSCRTRMDRRSSASIYVREPNRAVSCSYVRPAGLCAPSGIGTFACYPPPWDGTLWAGSSPNAHSTSHVSNVSGPTPSTAPRGRAEAVLVASSGTRVRGCPRALSLGSGLCGSDQDLAVMQSILAGER